MKTPVILTLDGSTRTCGAALLRATAPHASRCTDWEVLAERHENDNRNQAKLLLGMAEAMLQEVGLAPVDLSAIVVGTGPGTFTGVRIAVATARALGLALHVPVTGISTLSALTASALRALAPGDAPRTVVPVVDARRSQVFYGVYHRGDSGREWVRSEAFAACDPVELAERLVGGARPQGAILVVTEDAELVAGLGGTIEVRTRQVDAVGLVMGQSLLVEPGEGPEGDRLAPWLAGAFEGRVDGIPELVKPIYVRSPDADIHITKMRDPWSEPSASPAKREAR